ncbi:unnamed protein product [Musa acuminata var. zebrina]
MRKLELAKRCSRRRKSTRFLVGGMKRAEGLRRNPTAKNSDTISAPRSCVCDDRW